MNKNATDLKFEEKIPGKTNIRKMKLRFGDISEKVKHTKAGFNAEKLWKNNALSRNVLLPRVLDLVERTRICFTLGDNLRL